MLSDARRKPAFLSSERGNRERWLISYTDIVTILLILFVASAAQRLQKPALAAAAPPAPPPNQMARSPLLAAEKELRQAGLDPHLETRGLVVSLPQAVLFPSGEDRVTEAALPIVERIARIINSLPNRVTLVGHADSVPIHNRRFRNNWELSAARSLQLLEVLTSRCGVAESRLSVESDGSLKPKESNDTGEGRAENRRVEILIRSPAPL